MLAEGENRETSSSYQALTSTLVPLLLISIPMVLAFLYLRTKQPRVYAPRTFLDVLHEEYDILLTHHKSKFAKFIQGEDSEAGVRHVQLDFGVQKAV
jgi:hypothetical protein